LLFKSKQTNKQTIKQSNKQPKMSLLCQEDIVRSITELSPVDDLDDNLKYLVKSIIGYFKLSKEINYTYIIGLLENEDNKIIFYNLNEKSIFGIDYCPSAIIYNIANVDNNIVCYILALTTLPIYRNRGYAKKLLDAFAADIKEKYNNHSIVRLVLSATDESFSFYEKNEFVLIEDDLVDHPILVKHENYDKTKLYYIFEKTL
jgi:ribosomal protein S18 acetylase RimI-like enzyme